MKALLSLIGFGVMAFGAIANAQDCSNAAACVPSVVTIQALNGKTQNKPSPITKSRTISSPDLNIKLENVLGDTHESSVICESSSGVCALAANKWQWQSSGSDSVDDFGLIDQHDTDELVQVLISAANNNAGNVQKRDYEGATTYSISATTDDGTDTLYTLSCSVDNDNKSASDCDYSESDFN